MDEICSLRPLAINGKQVQIRKGSWIWSEENSKDKERPTCKQLECWWGYEPQKWGNMPTKLTIHQMKVIKGFHKRGWLQKG